MELAIGGRTKGICVRSEDDEDDDVRVAGRKTTNVIESAGSGKGKGKQRKKMWYDTYGMRRTMICADVKRRRNSFLAMTE